MKKERPTAGVVGGRLVIVPNRHQILVEETRVVHGVVLADQVGGDVTIRGGLVLAAGDHDGSQTIVAGATVLFGKYSGVEIPLPSLSTRPLRLIRYDDVYAVVLLGSDG